MSRPDPPAFFAGDLTDPWVAAIAASLPAGSRLWTSPGGLPDPWPAPAMDAMACVLHRSILTPPDLERLKVLRSRPGEAPRVILCVGPHARYHLVERCAALVDLILPEATAGEVVARHVGSGRGEPTRSGRALPVTVVGALHGLREALAETCRMAGHLVEVVRDWTEAREGGLAVWDVPMLEPDWPEVLAREAARKTVVTLLGFADRATVTLARGRGAAACLDLPCDPYDLVFVLDRLSARCRAEPGHAVPPSPIVARERPGSRNEGVAADPGGRA